MSGSGIVPGMSRSAPSASLLRSRTVADSAKQRHGHLASQFVLDAPANAVLEGLIEDAHDSLQRHNSQHSKKDHSEERQLDYEGPRTYVFAHAGAVSTSANRSIAAPRRSGLHLGGQRVGRAAEWWGSVACECERAVRVWLL